MATADSMLLKYNSARRVAAAMTKTGGDRLSI